MEKIKISLGVGDVTLRELPIDEAELETGVGNLSVIDTAAGEVELNTGVGSIQVDGGTSLMSASHKAPDGSCRLTGSTGVGGVSVTFR